MHSSTYQWHESPVKGYRCAHPGGMIKISDGKWRVYLGFPCKLFLHGSSAHSIEYVRSCGEAKNIGPLNNRHIRSLGLCAQGMLEIGFDHALYQQCPTTGRARYWEVERLDEFAASGGECLEDWDSTVSYDSSSSTELYNRFVDSNLFKMRVRRSRAPIDARLVQCPALLVRGGMI